jgi:serine phosphatase RsbU (regulator of sigma subunit)
MSENSLNSTDSTSLQSYKDKIEELNKTVLEYKQKVQKLWKMNETVYSEKKKSDGMIDTLLDELGKLEGEKSKYKEKTNKLWAQSVAIHKEKERIDQLKSQLEHRNKEITDSINYAERIQRSFLASKNLLDENLQDYFVFFQPKDVVSGDFYWASTIKTQENQNSFCYVTADSTGHGVPGAIMSIANIACLKEAVTKGFQQPDEILNETRKLVIEYLKNDGSPEGGKDGMDCSLLVLNHDKTQLSFASANNPVFIVRQTPPILPIGEEKGGVASNHAPSSLGRPGGVELLEFRPDKMPVGKHDKDQEPFTLQTIPLQKGDVIYTLTDGFPDQFGGEKGKKYMIKNLKELFLSISHLPMNEQHAKLEEEFMNWKGSNEQIDDVCIIGVRV